VNKFNSVRIKLIGIYYFPSEHNSIIDMYNTYLLIVNYGRLVLAFMPSSGPYCFIISIIYTNYIVVL
jgi:hypothetical protein